MGQHTGYRRGQHTNGQNTRFYQTSAASRKVIGQKHAPAIVRPPDHSKDNRNPAWAREAAAKVLRDQAWLKVADGYDPTCGLQPIDEWRREFAFVVLNDRIWCGMPEEPLDDVTRDIFGLSPVPFYKWLNNAPDDLRKDIQFVMEKSEHRVEILNGKKILVPINPVHPFPEKKEPDKPTGKQPTLTLLHRRMREQLKGEIDVMCSGGCGTDLGPRFRYAAENGTCPSVFIWKEDEKPYCGACYGNLPHGQSIPQPLVKQSTPPVNRPVSRMKLKAKYTRF